MKLESIAIQKETEQNFKKLMDVVHPVDTLLVLIFGSPDPDAAASAMALREMLQQKKGSLQTAFAATEPVNRQQNAEFLSALGLTIHPLDKVSISNYRLIALMDAQPSFFDSNVGSIRPQIVFDHHPRKGTWHAQIEDVRPQYGALSTVLTEYLLYSRVKISRRLHTALLYGIKTDTDNFDRAASIEDISAYTFHSKFANMLLIRRIELNQTPDRFLKYFNYAYHHMKSLRGRRVCFLGNVENADVCVQIADFYLRLIGTYYVVVAGVVENHLVIVFRGDGYRQNCGAIAQRAFGALGKGGGHRSAARVEIHLNALKEKIGGDLSQKNIENFLCLSLIREKNRKSMSRNKEKKG